MRKNRETSGIKTHDVKSAKNQFKKLKKKKKKISPSTTENWVRQCTPVILILGVQKQEVRKLEASLG